jgi:class 3 adenylate cyclase
MSLVQRWTWDLDAPRERLWQYIADTDWVNRHAGLPHIQARYEPLPEGGTRRIASFDRGPIRVEWEERPTIWQVPAYFEVERLYRHGPLTRFFNRTTLESVGTNRTRVVVDVELRASSPFAEPLLALLAAHGKRGANRAFRLAATLARRDQAAAPAQPRADLGPWQALRDAGIDADVVVRVAAFVDGAEDLDLLRIRPYELADAWNLSRSRILSAFLTATRLGLFNLRWSVLCPACRGPSPPIESLAQLRRGHHCEACNLAFDAEFDRSVEVTFDARPLGRGTEAGLFCIANPQRSAHVHAQASIAGHAAYEFALALPRGSYQLSALGSGSAAFVASDDETRRELTGTIHSDGGIEAAASVGAGDARVRIVNESDREVVVRVEDGLWPDTVATAAQVTAIQEFRDLFSSEVLAPGLDLGIETLAVLFTDVVGSTAIYSKTGDAPAFRIVADHFDVMRETVAKHDGAIVKTIGDAVMAAFTDPLDCLEAALDLDARVQTITAAGQPLRLRVGFHVGPCIAMRANDRIDYFGTTVNLAARLQKLADAGQVTLARSVAERPAIAQRLRRLSTAVANETLEIKGFSQRIDVVRVFT